MSEKLILGTRKGLLLVECRNNEWQVTHEEFPGIPVSYAIEDPRTGIFWAGLEHGHWGGKLHRSTDQGKTWEEIPAPKYPEGSTIKQDIPASTTYIWIIQPGGSDQPERLYIGTEPGGLFQSDDGGETFYLNEGLWNHPSREKFWFGGGRDQAGTCSIVVDPRDSNHVLVGVSVGGVYETWDGGNTWEGRNTGLIAEYLPNPHASFGHDPHHMLASPSNPDVLWQQNHCGIFRSEDGAKSWQKISQPDVPAHFGFPVALDEQDENVAWVAPAVSDEYRIPVDRALCISRTEDGGRIWTALRNGLPQENCYDIVFRHALDIDGNRLVFGTTGGNVYISEDRGEHWQCIFQNLAVVYSVRFIRDH